MEIKLPSLGEGIESGGVLSILVKEGDTIAADQGVLEIETDKATVEVPAPQAGKITKILVAEGDTIKIGQAIATLDPAANGAAKESSESTTQGPAAKGPAAEAPKQAEPKKPAVEQTLEPTEEEVDEVEEAVEPAAKPAASQKAAKSAVKSSSKPVTAKVPDSAIEDNSASRDLPRTPEGDIPGDGQSSAAAGPAVRRLARELGVDLRRVRPSGPGGRITRDDVQSFVRDANQKAQSAGARSAGVEPPGEVAVDHYGPIRRERMSRIRQTIAKNMLLSYTTIPQLTNFDDADVTDLEKIRLESKDDYARSGVKLTTMPFLIKAIASALRLHPIVNASIDEEHQQIVYKEYVNIGIAVDTDRGLIVPVMRDVDRMNIPQVAHALAKLSEKAREGTFSLDDLRGGTFTISNLGSIGGTYSTPIINPPEAAIVLAGRSRTMPIYVGNALVPRLMMPLSITYDHRVVDGAAAARFLNEVKGYLSAPGRLLLAP